MRKEAIITIGKPGRDKGKTFKITEMSAAQGEKWAIRLLFILARSMPDMSEEVKNSGMAGVATFDLKTIMQMTKFEDVEPLLDEMWSCVSRIPDTSHMNVVRPLVADDVEEIMTRMDLRQEAFKLHTDFLEAAETSGSTSESQPAPNSPVTRIAPRQSARSSPPAKRHY